ncbi:MFS general substrate transporter [Cylindrobasidium torrendii FP15055 ss-10]|uniref:MFS general substrate transporter n=1 Tax=Cylindrobasidium torrendii FP15055 ss-10 TaxID=1314674 RepID=A0A0D7BFI7_9AGAR|nr:MFS general substrate transporter [Cylindrobasidium torrendii FP15055 ss-10]
MEKSSSSSQRSSMTALEGAAEADREVTLLARRVEERIEDYGGDDVREPEPKNRPTFSLPPRDPALIDWDGPEDSTNPQNWTRSRKWMITMTCVLLSLNVSFASSAPTPASFHLMREFGINQETTYVVVTVFLVGFALGPSFWGPGSEVFGRRNVLLFTMSLYTLFHLGQALAKNIETLLICRFFSGFFGVSPFTICGGIIADVWPAVGRAPAISLFSASVFLGPVLGPIVGGFIATSDVTWRWIYWVMMIFGGFCTVVAFFLLPETFAPVILERKLLHLRKTDPSKVEGKKAERDNQDWSFRGLLHRTVFRPFSMLLQEPILVLVTLYMSLVYGVLYALFEAIPIIFMENHGFNLWQTGLVFIGVGVGTTIGALTTLFSSSHYPELVIKWKGFPPPEERLRGGMLGAPALVIGAFWMGWTGQYPEIHWIVPVIALSFIGASICLIFNSFLSYLVDTYLMFAASAFASNTIVRSLVAAAFPLFTVQMYHGLGINWASTLIGLIALVLAPIPFLFYKFGPRIRQNSKFAPCIDLKIAEVLRFEEEERSLSEKKATV